ncbi:MAG: hypothetical protein JRJ44_02890 [Deltaproteobacteria bacterium]|nr:hypothetical protein [Deltaproteobacteria bacterium]
MTDGILQSLPVDIFDLALQRKAAFEGIPYQTLIGSILHKYAGGFLEEAV